MPKTIAFLTLGCKLNYAETSTYERGFKAAGLEVVPPNAKADLYLVNTCSVTQHSDNKCRNLIRKCHRTNPSAAIIVTGCYAELRREEIAAIEGVKLVFGAKEKTKVVSTTLEMLTGAQTMSDNADIRNIQDNALVIARAQRDDSQDNALVIARAQMDDSQDEARAEEYKSISRDILGAFSTGERTRSFLKVQDGCDNFCAYCTVPFARGASRNLPISELVSQAEEIASSHIKEIVLTGVNTGDFGRSTGESFLDLLKALSRVQGIERYRISSIEPNLITEEIVDFLAKDDKFTPHFHIPLQTGCDELLAKVGRHYTTAFFADRIEYIRRKFAQAGRPEVFFGIDVIVGLPGETNEMFDGTYEFLRTVIQPAFIHIFPYSPRPGTRAAEMPNQVHDYIKTQRVAHLEELCAQLHEAFIHRNQGITAHVLWESSEKDGLMSGYTENYIRLSRPYDPALVGTIEEINILCKSPD